MRFAIGLLALIFVAEPSSAQFDLDMSEPDLNRATGKITLSDLAVNERGYVSQWFFCAENGQLFVQGRALLTEPRETGGQLVARRLPGNKVEFIISVGTDDSRPAEARESVISAIAHTWTCASARLSRPGLELLHIESIDGHETLSGLVGSRN